MQIHQGDTSPKPNKTRHRLATGSRVRRLPQDPGPFDEGAGPRVRRVGVSVDGDRGREFWSGLFGGQKAVGREKVRVGFEATRDARRLDATQARDRQTWSGALPKIPILSTRALVRTLDE
ncbi:uncharacterized protein PG998_006595 [Apiospora kogelbergensis]|uniref:uncharacterized protein n=1 Tax=Apiospora kogelbergensis TaxID=1337665 RepID=UPI00313124F8